MVSDLICVISRYQAQLVVLAAQISWSESMDKALQTIESKGDSNQDPLKEVQGMVEATLNVLASSVLNEQPPVRRKKMEQMVGIHRDRKYLLECLRHSYLYFRCRSLSSCISVM